MTTQEIVSKLWNLCNVLRDDGITYHQYVTELTYILFLKMAKETDKESKFAEGITLQENKDGQELTPEQKTQNHEKQIVMEYSWDKATRFSKVEMSNTIEHIELKDRYQIKDTPGTKLVKYMVGLKATQAFALQKKDMKRVEEIENWFQRFESILKRIFEDPSLKLDFDIESFRFSIIQKNREPFDFNTLSSGYAAVFDIINDLIMRVEKKGDNTEGIVLIDEIETHLHLELQKEILSLLVQMYPKIQFIVSTHSPFILSSIDNAVIFDLENKTLVLDGLANLPYEGIVEGYFETDRLSDELRNKFERYKNLVEKKHLSDAEYAEIVELEAALDEIPDYLALEFTTEYQRLKLEFENRE